MEFFAELRSAVRKMERGVSEVNQLMVQQADGDIGCQIVQHTLREKNTELKSMRSECCNLLNALNQNKFTEIISLSEGLLKRNIEVLAEIEEYLQKYGYKPPPEQPTSSLDDQADGEQDNLGETEENPVQDETPQKSKISSEGFDTPVQPLKLSAALPVTPKLSDFGISEVTMKILFTSMKERTCKTMVPDPTASKQNPASLVDISGVSSEHHSNPSVSDTNMTNKKVDLSSFSKTMSNGDQIQKNGADDDGESPLPPVLGMPGSRQLKNHAKEPDLENSESDTPEPPVLQTPGLKHLTVKPCDRTEEQDDTPELPFLNMLDTKEVENGFEVNQKEPELRFPHDVMDTPEAPEMTSDFGRMLQLVSSNSAQVVNGKNITLPTPCHQGHGVSENIADSPDASFLHQRADLPNLEDDESDLVEASFSYQEILSRGTVDPSTPGPLQRKTPKANVCSNTPHGYQVTDELSTPQMPELTSTFNFIKKKSPEIKTSTNSTQDGRDSNVSRPTFDDEDTQPCVYITRVSDEEFAEQPEYVKRFGLYWINRSIMKLNQLVGDKLKAYKKAILRQEDLLDDLKKDEVEFIFLCLTRLGRLSMHFEENGTIYYKLSM